MSLDDSKLQNEFKWHDKYWSFKKYNILSVKLQNFQTIELKVGSLSSYQIKIIF